MSDNGRDNQTNGGLPEPLSTEAGRNPAALVAAYEAALAVASELDLDTLLQRIVDLSRRVVPVRYAALGAADDLGDVVGFHTSGIAPETQAVLGPSPTGHGLVGLLIEKGQPLIVPDITAHPRSVGFPANHPPMGSLLGTPIQLGDKTLGNLYLCDRVDGKPFTAADLEAIQVLAAHAASAIERARLYGQVREARVRAEEQRDHLRVILDNLLTGVLIHSQPAARIELANASALDLLLSPDRPPGFLPVYGRDFELLQADGLPLPSDARPAVRALRGETVRNRQLLVLRRDGQTVPVLAQASPLRDAAGEVQRAVAVYQDMTRLRQAEQIKDDFLSLISHEFRTPLTAIRGGAQLLAGQAADLDADTRDELLRDIAVESERLERMLGNMLSLAAIQAGRLEASTEPVLLAPLARRVSADVARWSPNHRFVVDLPPDLPPAEGDPDLLAQVLRNLYENAVKYAPDGGTVLTSAAAEDTAVALTVHDGGVGIAAEHVPHVFERFRRPGADPTVRGMGLGLYLSRLLIETQGGSIEAASAGPGRGAAFTVRLPIARGWCDDGEA